MARSRIVFTRHALRQLEDRKVARALVEEALRNPDAVVLDSQGNPVAQKRYDDVEEGKPMLLRVCFVVGADGTQRVITMYKTSKLAKYGQGQA